MKNYDASKMPRLDDESEENFNKVNDLIDSLYEEHKRSDFYKKNLDDVILEFSINGISSHDSNWVDVDIRISSSVINYDLKDWESDGEIFERTDMHEIIKLMNRWMENSLTTVEEYETLEPDLLLKFYPGDERRIDFCICLQTNRLAFSENYIVLPLYNEDAIDFVEYWKIMDIRL